MSVQLGLDMKTACALLDKHQKAGSVEDESAKRSAKEDNNEVMSVQTVLLIATSHHPNEELRGSETGDVNIFLHNDCKAAQEPVSADVR